MVVAVGDWVGSRFVAEGREGILLRRCCRRGREVATNSSGRQKIVMNEGKWRIRLTKQHDDARANELTRHRAAELPLLLRAYGLRSLIAIDRAAAASSCLPGCCSQHRHDAAAALLTACCFSWSFLPPAAAAQQRH